ncbi:hypothetical protein ACFW9X_40315, partial [Streptomyces sp. NPDC059466]
PPPHGVSGWRRGVPYNTNPPTNPRQANSRHRGVVATPPSHPAERAHLLEAFPDGQVEEVYDVLVIVATRS